MLVYSLLASQNWSKVPLRDRLAEALRQSSRLTFLTRNDRATTHVQSNLSPGLWLGLCPRIGSEAAGHQES